MQVKEKSDVAQYLTLPGGKQEAGETMTNCVIRECAEEIGAVVRPLRLLGVADVFKPKDGAMRHQLEILFLCDIADDYVPQLGPHPDPSQIATRWANPRDEAALFRPTYGSILNATSADYLGAFDG